MVLRDENCSPTLWYQYTHTLSFIRTLTLDNFNSIFASSLISTFSLTFVRVFAYENFLHTQYFFMSTSEKVFLSFLSPFIRQYLFSVFFFLTQTFQTSSSFPFLFLFFHPFFLLFVVVRDFLSCTSFFHLDYFPTRHIFLSSVCCAVSFNPLQFSLSVKVTFFPYVFSVILAFVITFYQILYGNLLSSNTVHNR